MNKPETMGEFFDKRAETYDEHMKESIVSFDQLYSHVAAGILKTRDEIRILDIGCGTGLELEGIFRKAPKAALTCVDVSKKMLDKLKVKYKSRLDRITLVQHSYLIFTFGKCLYDYIVSVETLHHLLPDEKIRLYRKVIKALKPGGKYIEGDYIVTLEQEKQFLEEYHEKRLSDANIGDGTHHIDIPFSVDTQRRLLAEAGFSSMEIIWQGEKAAVYVAIV
jgi:tRNA (cmo5U34)-methyltransferase